MLNIKKYTNLNIGCSPELSKKFPLPWLNIDSAGSVADLICDARSLPKKWTNKFSEVRASHILEHLFLEEMDKVINEWVRVLAIGGTLRIIVPDLDIALKSLKKGFDSKGRPSMSISETTPVFAQIYGIGYDKKKFDEQWRHRFIFNYDMLHSLLSNNKYLENIKRYKAKKDPAYLLNIKDDSQNIFSLLIEARKKD